eukprot:TRINITY_DN13577_c0_g1_i1.p1 TRINITY_DN13577_c0_g1~~TRINITY_DN13577_c0_g1_i1.p1  ORF type:complete len:279 (+),score=22.15 TRINITY_DN13577_c0_g1_i1:62-898(+)
MLLFHCAILAMLTIVQALRDGDSDESSVVDDTMLQGGINRSEQPVSRSNGAHICNNGIHYYLEHAKNCSSHRGGGRYEMLGCELLEYQRGVKLGQLRDTQVHWYGGEPTQNMEEFREGSPRTDCRFGPNDGSSHGVFPIPDYCSRAMVSELSTVYDGSTRYTSLLAGAKALASTANSFCGWNDMKRGFVGIFAKPMDALFSKEPTSKACWNFVDDWKSLYCMKYKACRCPDDVTDENCHFNNSLVQCCRDKFEEFRKSQYAIPPRNHISALTGHASRY